MGFLSLLKVASMPILQMLIISILGAFMATDYIKLLPSDARRSLNKLGAFFIWTHTFHLIRSASEKYRASLAPEESKKEPNKDLEANEKSLLLNAHIPSIQTKIGLKHNRTSWTQIMGILHQLRQELLAPPILAAIIGLIFGAVSWLRNLVVGENAPLRVISDSIKLLGYVKRLLSSLCCSN
ncbi:protein PIN-LIKES 7 [Sesamum alatum]|uniref:Protein PIN-LIKES 7 n=1 Tax=Sesamum alatum TaxID=300844 RepID=A0AAE1XSS8_9LAMI|nr:protein PIN-LIKES 7 [Sesamum alatum]